MSIVRSLPLALAVALGVPIAVWSVVTLTHGDPSAAESTPSEEAAAEQPAEQEEAAAPVAVEESARGGGRHRRHRRPRGGIEAKIERARRKLGRVLASPAIPEETKQQLAQAFEEGAARLRAMQGGGGPRGGRRMGKMQRRFPGGDPGQEPGPRGGAPEPGGEPPPEQDPGAAPIPERI